MEYLIALVYILLGLIGGTGHYLKKKYIDCSTQLSFIEYLVSEPKATKRSIVTIIATEIGLSLASGGFVSGGFLSLGDMFGALTAGYAVDSGLNKAGDAQSYDADVCPRCGKPYSDFDEDNSDAYQKPNIYR